VTHSGLKVNLLLQLNAKKNKNISE